MSLLWNPSPALRKNSVLAHGPRITLALGLPMLALSRVGVLGEVGDHVPVIEIPAQAEHLSGALEVYWMRFCA